MRTVNSGKSGQGRGVVIKFLAAICLLVLAWAYKPAAAQGNCPDDVLVPATCYTYDDLGNQECNIAEDHNEYYVPSCKIVELPGPDVYSGCYGSTCHR
jgi:hypothetical protein